MWHEDEIKALLHQEMTVVTRQPEIEAPEVLMYRIPNRNDHLLTYSCH
jgi:hypothetical protein